MANIQITAVFSDEQVAGRAAEALAMLRGNGAQLSLSTRSASGAASGAASAFFPGLGAVSGPSSPHRSRGCILRAACDPSLEAYVVGELAALGAEKIDVHTS